LREFLVFEQYGSAIAVELGLGALFEVVAGQCEQEKVECGGARATGSTGQHGGGFLSLAEQTMSCSEPGEAVLHLVSLDDLPGGTE
jgi:hypothetical protein